MPSPLPSSTTSYSTSAPATSGGRRLDIQGLRAVAVLMVVAFHAGLPVPGGFVGVDVFFVISGFVITAMLHREHLATGGLRFGQFYLRRFKRLTPALALMVVVTVLISAFVLTPLGTQQVAAKTGLGAMLLCANWVIAQTTGGYFDAPAGTNPLLNTWSLSVEEQFYLAFPAVLALSWWIAGRTRGRLARAVPVVIVGLVAVASFALLRGTSGLPPDSWLLGFYSPLNRAWEFAVGALLALATSGRRVRSLALATSLGTAGAALLAASLWLIDSSTQYPGGATLLPVGGTLLLLAAGRQESNRVTRVLSSPPLVATGDWSYSIYLWHWPFIVFAGLLWPGRSWVLVLAAAASFGPALASYRWVEQPIRGLSRLSGPRLARVLALTLAPPLALSAALLVAAQAGWWSPEVRHYQAAVEPLHLGHGVCDTRTPQSRRRPGACTWDASAPGKPIYLVGDSNADHFSEGVVRAGTSLDRPVVISTTNACPFVDLYFQDNRPGWSSAQKEACRAYVRGTVDYLRHAPKGLVVIANSDEYWSSSDYSVGTDAATVTTDPVAKMTTLRAGLLSTVRELQRAGQRVMLVQTTPQWRGEHDWSPLTCTNVALLNQGCNDLLSVQDAAASQGPVRDVVAATAASTGASVWDSWRVLCPAGSCSTEAGDLIRYRDALHISVPQSEALAPAFVRAIRAAT